MKIQEILKQPEGKTLEYKRDISSLKPILKTLVSFANTASCWLGSFYCRYCGGAIRKDIKEET